MPGAIIAGELKTLLTAEDKTFSKGLQGATRTAAGWAANIGKTVVAGGLALVAAGALAATAAVTGLAVGIGKLAVEAAPLEGIGIAFDVMSERVGLSLEDLQKAAAGTISNFDLMKASNVALTGAGAELGTELGENLPRLLEIARAAAKATGQDVGFLFESLVTGVKRSSPMLIDNTGLTLKVGEANEALAESLGITVDELSAEQKQIALLNATVLAGQVMVEEFGGGQVTAAEQLAQFKASIQNTKDEIGLAFLPALQAVMKPIQALAGEAGPKLIEWAQTAGVWLGEKLPGFIDIAQLAFQDVLAAIEAFTSLSPGDFPWEDILPKHLADIAYEIADAFEQFVAVLESGQGVFAGVVEVLDDFLPEETIDRIWEFHDAAVALSGEAIEGVVDFWNNTLMPAFQEAEKFIKDNLTPIIGGLQGAFAGLAIALAGGAIAILISAIGSAIAAVATPVMALIALGALIGAAWAGNWGGIRDIVHSVIYDTVLPAVEAVRAWFEENWPLIQAVALTAWEVIRDIATTVADLFVNDILPKFQEAFASIGEALATLGIDWGTLGDIVKAVLAIVAALIVAAIGVVTGFATGVAAAFANMAAMANAQITNFKAIIDNIVVFFTDMVAAIKAVFAGDWEEALDLWNSSMEAAQGIIEGIINAIWLFIKSTFGTILAFIGGFVDGVVGFFQGLWDRLTGGSIIPDMMADIQSIITTALDAISGLWETFKDNIIGFVETLKTDLDTKWDNIKTALETAWTNIKTSAETKAADVWEAITTAIDQIKTDMDTTWENVKSAFSTAWDKIKVTAETVVAAVWLAVTTKIDEIKTDMDTTWTNIKSAATTGWDNIKAEIETRVGEIIAEIESMFTESLATVKEFVADFVEAGVQLIDGLIEGIRLQALKLFRIVRDTIQGALDVVNDVLNIGSPSRIMVDIGENIVNALIEGVLNRQSSWFGILSELFDISRVFGGLGMGALRLFRERQLKPLDDLIDDIRGGLEEHADRAAEIGNQMFDLERERRDLSSERGLTLEDETERMARLAEINADLARLDADRLVNLGVVREQTERLAEVERERAELAEKEAALQEAQANLDFLKKQAELVKLVSDEGMDLAEILGDVQLGIDADEVGILEAMTRAIEILVQRTQEALPGAGGVPTATILEPAGIPTVYPEIVNPYILHPPAYPPPIPPSPVADVAPNQFILHVTTLSAAEDIIADFQLMQAMAGV